MDTEKNNNLDIPERLYRLHQLMEKEICLQREVLSTLQEEQMCLLENDSAELKLVLAKREPILEQLTQSRDRRIKMIGELAIAVGQSHLCNKLDDESSLGILLDCTGVESIELLLLRDQMLALLDKMKALTIRNNYLLESKITSTKDLIQSLNPKPVHPTYNKYGTQQSHAKKTVMMINQEV